MLLHAPAALHRQAAPSSHSCTSQRTRRAAPPAAAWPPASRRVRVFAGKESPGKEVNSPVAPPSAPPPPPGAAEAADTLLSERLKALKDAQKPGSAGPDEFGMLPGKAGVTPPEAPQAPSNPFAAAAQEARLITVPALPAVLSTTLAVLAIVIASTVAILAVNGLLAVASEKLFG